MYVGSHTSLFTNACSKTKLVRFEFGIRLEVEDQHVLPAKTFAARIHKLARAQKYLNPRLILFLALPFFLGLFHLGFFLGLALLQLPDPFLGFFVFFLLLFGAQRLAVFFHARGYFLPVEIEKSVLVGLS